MISEQLKIMKTSVQRLNNIIGQLNGAKKLLTDRKRDCFSLLIQLKASRSGLDALMEKLVSEEFDHCLLAKKADRPKMEKIFKGIIKK